MTQINHAADAATEMLRISIDAKAIVKVDPFARGAVVAYHIRNERLTHIIRPKDHSSATWSIEMSALSEAGRTSIRGDDRGSVGRSNQSAQLVGGSRRY